MDETVLSQAIAQTPNHQRLSGVERLIKHVSQLTPMRMAVVHPCDALSLAGAIDAFEAGIINPIFVGPEKRIREAAKQAKLSLNNCEIIDAPHSHAAAATAAKMAGQQKVEGLMKGSLHTDEYLAAILHPEAGLRTDRRLSHCYVMETAAYPRPFIITDAAINISPNLNDKADIIRNAIELAQALGVSRPKVAILAAIETINAHMPATLDAAALCKMADRGQITGGILDGPLALDNAVSPDAVRVKGIRSDVAGQADILVVPNLESGNMLAKQLEYLSTTDSAGIVMGARVPVVLTSRADSRKTRLASCAIALLLARRQTSTPK
ncbi:MAG TPA: bifunctional enoyl-CoA hydratase/phosphate acetyltransferase [Burkholderiaceae bacterium]|nr:bifunctional enoyl-CoA hydratase/phosphate acetyltransferase [Burkholderiaceae bacterium]